MRHPVDPSYYDASDPFGSLSGGRTYPHTGSDYTVAYGEVYSVADAVVYHTGFNSGNGNYICCYLPGFDWKDGVQGGLYVAYLHLSSINVSEGQTVKQDERIGVSGNSGTNSRGPHLHITFSNSDLAYLGAGNLLDPYAYIQAHLGAPAKAPAPKPVAEPKPLTEVQKLQAQRSKLIREIALLKKQGKEKSAKGLSLARRLKTLVARIATLSKKK
jgi:hypothetical protein